MRKYFFLFVWLACTSIARGQTLNDLELSELFQQSLQVQSLQYWFDSDETTMQVVNGLTGAYQIDVSSLSDGLHTLHFQAKGTDGMGYGIASMIFLKMSPDSESPATNSVRAGSVEYWFDSDETTIQVVNGLTGAYQLDVSSLSDGLHTIHCQVKGIDGIGYDINSKIFLKIAGGLSEQTETAHAVATRLRYWFNQDMSQMEYTDIESGTQMIDVSGLPDGLHTLCYQLVYDDGNVSPAATGIFLKSFEQPDNNGPNCITKYQYWLNGNSIYRTVETSSTANPYCLVGLLPVPKEPIRSSSFHFEVKDGVPMMYAKNDFHIRFHDKQGYFLDDSKAYIDYNVKQELTNILLLESGVRQTVDRPAENGIVWYQLDAEPGDSLQFKLDRAATIQLYAPSGKEVYRASGAESVKWGGLHVWEEGTFYVALHDVTAQNGNTVNIDYNHIDKYAVLRQDVRVAGNGGCSTITFEGNGFRDLYAVDLYNAQGDTIKHVYIGHESDATTSVVFDFSDAATGKYHALFRFAEEDKVFTNLVTVEEARDIELATTVTYPSTFRGGTSTTYTVKITNKGNMTAYKVPVFAYIKSKTEDGVYGIKFKGFDLQTFAEAIEIDSISDDDKEIIREYSDSCGDDWNLIRTKVEDENNPGDSIIVRSNYFFVDISPNETKTLELSMFTKESKVYAYFTTPKEWMTLSVKESAQSRKINANVKSNGYCCVKEGVECLVDMFNYRMDIGSVVLSIISAIQPELLPIAQSVSWVDCGVSSVNTAIKIYGDFACNSNEESVRKNILPILWKNKQSIFGATLSCISATLDKMKSTITGGAAAVVSNIDFGKIMKSIAWNLYRTTLIGTMDETIACVMKFVKPTPSCSSDLDSGGGTSTPVYSCDPNDIYGYTAESGSKAIKDGQTDVYYRIEFENDTTFATAAAHEIVVTDTLSKELFDLSSFAPTRVRIGEKSAELTGDKNFVTTIDMRPEINAIAQVEGTFDEQKGIAKWHITSLDPMTMEPTDDVMQGVLPVNYDGSGIGEVSFDISLKPDLAHGTEVKNRAAIVFDTNDVIMTPTWTNTIDRVAPESHIVDVQQLNDSTASVRIEASDELSGPWRYDVYVQYGEGSAWWKMAENVPVDTTASVKIYEGIDHGFYVVVTDSAGNVERKEAARELTLDVLASQRGDVNGDGAIDIADVVAVYNIMAGNNQNGFNGDVNKDGAVDIADVVAVYNIMAGRQVANARANVRANIYRHSK